MSEKNTFDLSADAAEAYQRQKVPALFAPMAEATINAVSIPKQAEVLDIACGTGAIARAVAARLTEPSRIVGTDLNSAMIDVARSNSPDGPHSFEWVSAPADDLPFNDATFSLSFCQQGLQFFPDKPAALTEVHRVLKHNGRLILTCWAAIPPFFTTIAEVLGRHLDETAAAKAIHPFIWNDGGKISQLMADAGFERKPPAALPVFRRMPATLEAVRDELLASPNETVFRAAGDAAQEIICSEILADVETFRDGEILAMPQQAHLFDVRAI